MRYGARTLLVWVVLLLAPSCGEQGDVEVTLLEELRHADGLVVRRPDGFSASIETDGFAFTEDGMIRSPRTLRIAYREQAPDLTPTDSRGIPGSATASYVVEQQGGGSGGTEYQLTAWRAVDGAWIVVSESAQEEFGEPAFAVAWALMAHARIEKPGE